MPTPATHAGLVRRGRGAESFAMDRALDPHAPPTAAATRPTVPGEMLERLAARRTRSRVAPRALAALGALALSGCARAPEQAVSVVCSEIQPAGGAPGAPAPAVGPDDVLEVVVALDSVPAGPGSVRVRVDGLADPGLVAFFMPPPTAASAAMTLQPPPTFQGCVAVAPAGFELQAPSAPRAKAWVRVSSDRPVRVRPRVEGRAVDEPLLLEPGTSGVVGWGG